MKYKITLKDGIELLITADKEVDAIRQAKVIKDSLSGFVHNSLAVCPVNANDELSFADDLMTYRKSVAEAVRHLEAINGKYNEQDKMTVLAALDGARNAVIRAKSNWEKWYG